MSTTISSRLVSSPRGHRRAGGAPRSVDRAGRHGRRALRHVAVVRAPDDARGRLVLPDVGLDIGETGQRGGLVLVDVAVLDDQPSHARRRRQPEPNLRPVVVQLYPVAGESQNVGEPDQNVALAAEGVVERRRSGRPAVAEAGEVRRDEPPPVAEGKHKVAQLER